MLLGMQALQLHSRRAMEEAVAGIRKPVRYRQNALLKCTGRSKNYSFWGAIMTVKQEQRNMQHRHSSE